MNDVSRAQPERFAAKYFQGKENERKRRQPPRLGAHVINAVMNVE